jgi:hypothetical protein
MAWLARARDEGAGVQQLYKPLGEFLELADHLRFDAALKAAQAWFEHLERDGKTSGAAVAMRAPDTSSTFARTRPNGRPMTPRRGSRITFSLTAGWHRPN